MNWFSLDSVILIIYSDLQLFAIFILGEVDFSETYLMSAENNSRFLASKFDPATRLVPSASAVMPPPPHPRYKKHTYGPAPYICSAFYCLAEK